MARYKIYNNERVITPIGEVLDPEEWLERYPWARFTKMIVGGGVINGSCALVFDDYVEMAKKNGCDFTGCKNDDEILARIEAFEDNPPVVEAPLTDEARIADALEDLVVLRELSMEE